MNWLAHAILSPPDPEVRMGNVLADMIPRDARAGMSDGFREGMQLHLAIDSFTDSHPVVLASKRRFESGAKRYSGAILDVFFDHFLVASWEQWSEVPVSEYLVRLYSDFQTSAHLLPASSSTVLARLIEEDWMGSYSSIDGIDLTLKRMSHRVRYRSGREIDLSVAISDLNSYYEEFRSDFQAFFPELRGATLAAFEPS